MSGAARRRAARAAGHRLTKRMASGRGVVLAPCVPTSSSMTPSPTSSGRSPSKFDPHRPLGKGRNGWPVTHEDLRFRERGSSQRRGLGSVEDEEGVRASDGLGRPGCRRAGRRAHRGDERLERRGGPRRRGAAGRAASASDRSTDRGSRGLLGAARPADLSEPSRGDQRDRQLPRAGRDRGTSVRTDGSRLLAGRAAPDLHAAVPQRQAHRLPGGSRGGVRVPDQPPGS